MCGIFGIINQKEDLFDYKTFCTLGVANDIRGGDSCGVFIDGKTEYGIGDKSYFESFFWDSELLNTVKTARIALGHDRKASKGGVSLEKAHPIVITEPVKVAEGEEPRQEVKFVMVHNGTIYNEEELAKKYIPDVDIKGMSDSQVIARLLYYSGFDWLAEYNGGTAFIAVDYREKEPKVLVWRGESKKYSTSGKAEEERPLFCNTTNGRLVISSIASYLAICDENCWVVPANKVLTYMNGKMYILKNIDRSKSQQIQEYHYSGNTNYSSGNNYSNVYYYLITTSADNRYKVLGNPADGILRMTSFGRILGKGCTASSTETEHKVAFFNGVALKSDQAYKFIYKAWRRSKLELSKFCDTYENFIRYFSCDGIYLKNGFMYKAIEPWKREPFTGTHHMLTDTTSQNFINGLPQYTYKTKTTDESFDCLKEVPKYDFKTIWKEFIQSME